MTPLSQAGYEEVGWKRRWTVPAESAIFHARSRLGVEPIREPFDRARGQPVDPRRLLWPLTPGQRGRDDPGLGRHR
jgi:hypothetical protein